MDKLIYFFIIAAIAYTLGHGDPNVTPPALKNNDSTSSFDEYIKSLSDESTNSGINPSNIDLELFIPRASTCDQFTYDQVIKWLKNHPPKSELLPIPEDIIDYNNSSETGSEITQDPCNLQCSDNFISTTYENYFNFNSDIYYLKANIDFYFYLVQCTTLVTLAQCQYCNLKK